jgi:hypothetical protein
MTPLDDERLLADYLAYLAKPTTIDRRIAESKIVDFYRQAFSHLPEGEIPPRIHWFDDPFEAVQHILKTGLWEEIPSRKQSIVTAFDSAIYLLGSLEDDVSLHAMTSLAVVQRATTSLFNGLLGDAAITLAGLSAQAKSFLSTLRYGGSAMFRFATDRAILQTGLDYVVNESLFAVADWTWAQVFKTWLERRDPLLADVQRASLASYAVYAREAIAQTAGHWWPYSRDVVLAAPHSRLMLNDEGEPHCEDGPAIAWPSGRKLWFIDGVHLGDAGRRIVLDPEHQSIVEIKNEVDDEIRRIRIERYGRLRYLKATGAWLVDARENLRDNQPETLYMDADGDVFLVVIDPSTGREYAIPVDRSLRTCADAQSWVTHGLDAVAIHRS